MNRNNLLVSLMFLVCSGLAFAQDPNYRLIEQDGHEIHLLTFDPEDFDIIEVKASDDQRKTVQSLAQEHKAYAAINGGYFDYKGKDQQKAKAVGALKIKGQWFQPPGHMRGVLCWKADDQKPYFNRFTKKQAKARCENFDYVVGGIPLLLKDKKPVDSSKEGMTNDFRNERHARTAVCAKKDGTWLWLVASHSKAKDRPYLSKTIEGLTLKELTDTLLKEGCVDAINLDGGGSSTLVIEDKVINKPAGDFNPITQSYEERAIYDAMVIVPKNNS
ncbi:MAG: phosphodiester glycosidase family protein [Candidatus Berkiella sp.]